MSNSRKRGFATLSPAQRIAVSRKGGRAKVPKGLAKLTPEQLSEISRKGVQARWAKYKLVKEEYGKDSIPSRDGSSS